MADPLWLAVVAGGPLLLGAVFVFVLLRQREPTLKEKQDRKRKVEQLYDGD